METRKRQDLLISIYEALDYLVKEQGADSMSRYLKTRYGSCDVDKISPSRYEDLFSDLYQKECDLRY